MSQRYERVQCANGFSMSVQAHDGAYCDPRVDGAASYQQVEIGFPQWDDDAYTMEDGIYGPRKVWTTPFLDTRVQGMTGWAKMMKNGEFYQTRDPRMTVYAYVDMTTVLQVIRENGGMVGGQLPPHNAGTVAKGKKEMKSLVTFI